MLCGRVSHLPWAAPHALEMVLCWLSWFHVVYLDPCPGPQRIAAGPSEHIICVTRVMATISPVLLHCRQGTAALSYNHWIRNKTLSYLLMHWSRHYKFYYNSSVSYIHAGVSCKSVSSLRHTVSSDLWGAYSSQHLYCFPSVVKTNLLKWPSP